MRNLLLLVFIFSFSAVNVKAQSPAGAGAAPQPDTSKPYEKNPTLPAFNITEADSSTIFNTYNIPKGHITALVLFDPDCSHCQRMVADLVANMDDVKQVRFYMFSLNHNFQRLRDFYKENHLENFKNIMVYGRDPEFFFINFYKTRSYPVIVLYDKHKKFIALKEGEFKVKDIVKMLQ